MPEESARAVSGCVRGIPTVEIADHGHGGGVRGPDREVSTLLAIGAACHRMGPELLVGAHVRAFAKEIDVVVGEKHLASVAITIPECRKCRSPSS